MDKAFKLYVMDFDWVVWSEYGGLLGVVAEDADEAYRYLADWDQAYGTYGDNEVTEEELRRVVEHAKVFELLGSGVEAGVNFTFIT